MADDRQFDAHLKGKKHIKAAKELRKAMREEDFALGVSDGVSTAGTATPNIKQRGDSFDLDVSEEEEAAETHQDFVYLDEVINEDQPVDSAETLQEPKPEETPIQDAQDEISPAKPQDPADKDSLPNPTPTDKDDSSASDSEASLEKELDALFLGSKDRAPRPHSQDSKPKIGAAKAKRQKKAEKLAALEAEGKAPPKGKQRKAYDPVAAMQKARGETVTTGKKGKKK
jgi:DnaJ family protein A protein 5